MFLCLGLSFDLTGSYTPANYCGAVLWLIAAALYLAIYCLKNRKNRLRMGRYSSVRRRSSDKNASMLKVETCTPLTVAHALTEKGVDLEGALEVLKADVRDSTVVVAQEHTVVVDKVSTV